MCFNTILKCLYLSVSVSFVIGASVSQRYTLPRVDYKLKTSTQDITCSGIAVCCAICNQIDDCLTVSFKKSERRCLLGMDRVTHDISVTRYLDSETGWLTMSKVIYTVFSRRSPLGHYQATYADAVSLCAEKGTVVASTTDLLASRSMGFDMCTCAWLSNQRNGFVIQIRDWRCWGSFSSDILWCDHGRANVWCRL